MSRCFDCLAEKSYNPSTDEEYCKCERFHVTQGLNVRRPSINVEVGSMGEFVSAPSPPMRQPVYIPYTPPPEPLQMAELMVVDTITGDRYKFGEFSGANDMIVKDAEGREMLLVDGSWDVDWS